MIGYASARVNANSDGRRFCRKARVVHFANGQSRTMVCGKPKCSDECRLVWARKTDAILVQSFRVCPPTHWVTISGIGLSDEHFTAALQRFRRRLKNKMGCEYFMMNEWAEITFQRHAHFIIWAPGFMSNHPIDLWWKRSIPKGVPYSPPPKPTTCAPVTDPNGLARYITKNITGQGVLPPVTFTGRVVCYSEHFLAAPAKVLWQAQVAQWFPDQYPDSD